MWSHRDEVNGMKSVRAFAAVGMLGTVLSVALSAIVASYLEAGVSYTGSLEVLRLFLGVQPASFSLFVALVMLSGLQFVLLFVGFRLLSWSVLGTKIASRFVATGFVGLAVLISGVGYIVAYAAPDFESGVPAQPANTILPSPVGVGAIVLAVGTGMVVIGLAGMALGMWRVGDRYRSPLLKAGAVMSVVPLLNYAAPAAVFIGSGILLKEMRENGGAGETLFSLG